jgi:signal transduction histidine kinase
MTMDSPAQVLSVGNRFVRNVKRANLVEVSRRVNVVRRFSWQLPAAAILLVLLATLATFQYRWLGEVSRAEGERMRGTMRTRAADFSQEFDREISRTYLAFQIPTERLGVDPASELSAAFERWRAAAPAPALVREIYLLEGASFDTGKLQRLNRTTGQLEPAEWPADLAASVRDVQRPLPRIFGTSPLPMMTADAIDVRALALIVPLPRISKIADSQHVAVLADSSFAGRVLIVRLDADVLRQQILQPLIAKYFGEGEAAEYHVTIVSRDDPSATVFATGGDPVTATAADVTAGLFDLRPDEVNRLALTSVAPPEAGQIKTEHMAITIVRRGGAADGPRMLLSAVGSNQGVWQVRVRHRDGSLEAIVARSRRRNLAISLGVLGLLGASFVLVAAASRRQQRLSQQQMEFVASISHELRTPLAVICSAGENLADGVVADVTQVRKYGLLIETEGRRLGDMVERVMEFAGISSGSHVRLRPGVDVGEVLASAVRGTSSEAAERDVSVTLHPHGGLPPITADADALRSAVQNVIGNAVKYSPPGSTVDVHAGTSDGAVRIQIVDRGLGIDAADLPHVFKPFFRGRRAVDAQVRGSGIGLSVVRHVLDNHDGSIAIDSHVGQGTTVTVELPEQR